MADSNDEKTVEHWNTQRALRRVRELAMDRVRATRLRIACGTFGRRGGAHRERRARTNRARLLYRLLGG